MLHPEDRERVLREALLAHESGGTFRSEYRVVRPDGRAIWLRDEAGTVSDDAGRPLFLQGVMFDVTEIKEAEKVLREAKRELERRVIERTAELSRELQERTRAEQALRESEARFRALFESAAIGIAIADPEGRLMQVNDAFRRMLGYTLDELRTMTFMDITYPGDRADTERLARQVLDGERDSYHLEKRYQRKDGSFFWANLAASAVRDAAGRVQYWLGAVEDMTVRRTAQEELVRRHQELVAANRELERLHRAKDEFVAMVSHELRTPLVTGLGYIELLLEGHLGAVTAEATEGMKVALRNLRCLSGLIDDILSYHSLARRDRRSGPVLVSIDLAEMFRECREEFLVRSGRDGSRVELDLPAGPSPVMADEDMLRRALSNLLDNAHRHAGPSARVRLSAAAGPAGGVRISVSDDGPGMSPEHQDRVFEPFVKLSGGREGAGLGLAIVRSILEAHGTRPDLRSAPGEGTEISFTLPVSASRRRCPRPPGRPAADAESAQDTGAATGGKILVVDDDPDTLELVRTALTVHGLEVLTAGSAEDALEVLSGNGADMLLLDMSLPGMDGAELCARLKAGGAAEDVPIYMLSARAEEPARERARDAGCDGYIVKPVVVAELVRTVQGALAGR
jgi:PAS domain S-box-containing protein